MNHLPLIEPFADGLEKLAAAMDDHAIGGHPTRGHAAVLRNMAACMRADAVQGKMPHAFEGASIYASSSSTSAGTKLSAMSAAALVKAGIEVPGKDGEKIPVGKLNDALAKSSMTTQQRIALKTEMAHAGLID